MADDGTKIKAVFFPYHPENPYQPNLGKALGERGVVVEGVKDSLEALINAANDKDILHLHWAHSYLLSAKLLTSIHKSLLFFKFLVSQKIHGRKLIWTIHNLAEHEPRHPVFEKFCYQCLARLANGIIVHSQYAKEKVRKTYRLNRATEKIRVIPHGNYIGNYPNDISTGQARKELGIGLEKKVFLFLGAIRGYKGIPELVSAFNRSATVNDTLIIAGKPLNEKIEAEIFQLTAERDDINFFPGFVADEDIQKYLNAADAVVFPFRDIFTSGSALLAMSFGKAIIAPELKSLEELSAFGGTITYDQEKGENLQTALVKTASLELEHLGECNLEAAKMFSWDSIGEETLKLYNDTLR